MRRRHGSRYGTVQHAAVGNAFCPEAVITSMLLISGACSGLKVQRAAHIAVPSTQHTCLPEHPLLRPASDAAATIPQTQPACERHTAPRCPTTAVEHRPSVIDSFGHPVCRLNLSAGQDHLSMAHRTQSSLLLLPHPLTFTLTPAPFNSHTRSGLPVDGAPYCRHCGLDPGSTQHGAVGQAHSRR